MNDVSADAVEHKRSHWDAFAVSLQFASGGIVEAAIYDTNTAKTSTSAGQDETTVRNGGACLHKGLRYVVHTIRDAVMY